jgi:hypothetical protein
VGFGTTDQALMRFSAFGSTGEKIGGQWDNSSAIHNFKKAYDSVRREVLYNILRVLGTHEITQAVYIYFYMKGIVKSV